jgi:hypothetical protein
MFGFCSMTTALSVLTGKRFLIRAQHADPEVLAVGVDRQMV